MIRWRDDEVALMQVLLADDQPSVRFALRVLLERQPQLKVVGAAVNVDDLLAQVKATCPDLVLLSWELPGLVAEALLATLRRNFPDLTVIVLSGRPKVRRAALGAGADAFVSKADPPDRLLAAISDCERSRRLEDEYIEANSKGLTGS
jgi:DNA-binding NarL/FixJ family response regulator